jgi:GNAT superfamily N-acetyltransferase
LRRLLDTGGGDGDVVVACLALKPYLPPEDIAAVRARRQGVAAEAASGNGMHAPPDDPAVLAALNASASAELERMVVHPVLRRCGAASLLLGRAEAWCRAHGYSRLVLSTLASMKPGLALYQRRGFGWMPGWPPEGIEHDSDGDKIHICWLVKDI